MRNGADVVAGRLAAIGCKRAFGIPGGEVLALVEGLERANIHFYLTKHENCAGFMGEGAWHADGSPAVLVATLGPGVANAVNVVANAMQDRVPLIFLTGCVDESLAARYTHQIFDHQALLRPIVKGTFRLSEGTIARTMDKALALALDGQPGPVHIDVPISIAEGESDELSDTPFVRPIVGPAPEPIIEQAKVALASAERPIMIAGVDAVNEDAGSTITEFCRTHQIPLITTYKGKGLLDEGDPLALGGAGLSPKADKVLLPLLAEADTVILAGYDPIEMRAGWIDPWSPETSVLDISPVRRDHGVHSITISLLGSVRKTLARLSEGLRMGPTWRNDEAARARETLISGFAPEGSAGGSLTPDQVFATTRRVAPEETVATADSGAHRILMSQMWSTTRPHTVLQSSALCTMGCALPLGMGYKLAKPDTPIVVFVGDACLEMVLGELATLRDLGLPILIIVLADASLALIELKQRGSQRPNAGVDFGGTDFPAVATAYGGKGYWIDDVQSLERRVEDALKSDTFTILACRIGRRAYDGKL